MKPLLFTSLALGLLLAAGCDFAAEDDTSGTITLTGQVLNKADNNPIPDAYVQVLPLGLSQTADEAGHYVFSDVEIDSTMELTVTARKDGFSSASERVLGLADTEIKVPPFKLVQTAEAEPVSGKASNILLLGQSAQSIGVVGSGSKEVTGITFQVTDSLGRPVILDHTSEVRFKLGVHPGGGEFIYPESAVTDNAGKVEVHLSSGTKAGVVQFVAETVVDGRTIVSRPVSVAIHGGLPDQDHFSFGPAQSNFPGLVDKRGLKNEISVIVGDKHANPVRPGTSVYFTTTAGVVGGSLVTDGEGRGSVQLMSGNPEPPQGVAVVTATTADENEELVSGQIPLVFSGPAIVDVEPKVARLDQTYTLKVRDHHGNPLAPGTSIVVEVEGAGVQGVGHTNVLLGDTIFGDGARDADDDGLPDGVKDGDALDYEDVTTGPGRTVFTFRASETWWDGRYVEEVSVDAIKITVSGPNVIGGNFEIVLPKEEEGAAAKAGSRAKAYSPTEGVVAEELPSGGMRFRVKE